MTDERAKWLDWRRQGAGASDVAAYVTGLYGGPVGVVADKLGIGSDDIDPALAERGHRWEQPAADAIGALYGLYPVGEQAWIEHGEQPRWRATVEGLLHFLPEAPFSEVDTLFEVKTTSVHVWPKWEYYEAQTQWQMFVAGMRRCLLVVLVVDDSEAGTDRELRDMRFRWIYRDDYVIEQLELAAIELWSHVEAGTLPEPSDGSTLDIIRQANAVADPTAVAAIDDIEDTIADYTELKKRAKAAQDALKLGESRIRMAMAEATEATTSDGRWRVRVGKPIHKFTKDSEADALEALPHYGKEVLDRARFEAEEPELYESMKRPTADRRLTIKEMSE